MSRIECLPVGRKIASLLREDNADLRLTEVRRGARISW